MRFGIDVPKKYIHSIESFCENNNFEYDFYNLASVHIDQVAEIHFYKKEHQEKAAAFLHRLVELDRD
jgi:hypothetical protein